MFEIFVTKVIFVFLMSFAISIVKVGIYCTKIRKVMCIVTVLLLWPCRYHMAEEMRDDVMDQIQVGRSAYKRDFKENLLLLGGGLRRESVDMDLFGLRSAVRILLFFSISIVAAFCGEHSFLSLCCPFTHSCGDILL